MGFVVRGLENAARRIDRSVLTVGNFDGVHLAHQKLIVEAKQLAEQEDVPVIALTFDPHPLSIVAPERAPPLLCTLDDKLARLSDAGANVVVAKSEPSLLSMEPEAFVKDVLVRIFRPLCIVEGPSFGFGRGRKGTPQTLQKMADELGFSVRIVEPVTIDTDGEKLLVSSSLIRKLLLESDVMRAAHCLGRPYAITGKVVRGHGRGRQLGFPTANIGNIPQLVPGDGVYSGRANFDNNFRACAISIGSTPTFRDGVRQVEAHLLDFDGDLYDRDIRLEFDRLLRRQQKFETVGALGDQLLRDVGDVRRSAAGFDAAAGRVYRAEARSQT